MLGELVCPGCVYAWQPHLENCPEKIIVTQELLDWYGDKPIGKPADSVNNTQESAEASPATGTISCDKFLAVYDEVQKGTFDVALLDAGYYKDSSKLNRVVIEYLRGKVTELEERIDYLETEKDAERKLVSAQAYLRAYAMSAQDYNKAWEEAIEILNNAFQRAATHARNVFALYRNVNDKYRHLWDRGLKGDQTCKVE